MLRVESKHVHSWLSLFRTTRGSVTVLVVAGLGLVLPGQTGDELVALSGMKVGPVPGVFVLQFALGSLSISAWYWARAALAARFGVDDALESRQSLHQTHRKAFDIVPRLSFLFGVALSIVLVWRGPTWTNAISVAAWAIPAYMLIRWRLAVSSPSYRSVFVNLTVLRSRRHFRQWLRVIIPRLRALLMLAPFGPWVATPLLGIGVAVFVWGAVEDFVPWTDGYPGLPALAARVFPGPSVALVGFAMMIGPLTALIFVMDGLRLETVFLGRRVGLSRPPVIFGLLAWSLLAPLVFSLHTVRVLDPAHRTMAVEQRAPLRAFFTSWAAACAADPDLPARPIIVAVSGGGSRAGIWGAQVLAAVDGAAGLRNAAIFAISSVSGGSLGAAAYMAVTQAVRVDCLHSANGGASRVSKTLDKVNNDDLGGDALGPLLAGTLLSDAPRALLSPLAAMVRLVSDVNPRGGDRAEALERAFEGLWLDDLRRAGLLNTGIPLFSAGYLSLSYKDGKPRPGQPLWIVNGTDLATGGRMLTVPFSSTDGSDWPFLASSDVLGLLGADVPISTAINNGARIPYLEPSGEVVSVDETASQVRRGRPELLDGAYFDNEGALTALELANWLKRQTWNGRPVEPIIVQVTANADIDPAVKASVVRCPDHPLDTPTELPPSSETLQFLVPIMGLNNVRAAHDAVLLRQVRDQFCGPGDRRAFFHFYLFGSPDQDIPLNWLLSPPIVAAIRGQLSTEGIDGKEDGKHDGNGNDAEYRSLSNTLRGTIAAASP